MVESGPRRCCCTRPRGDDGECGPGPNVPAQGRPRCRRRSCSFSSQLNGIAGGGEWTHTHVVQPGRQGLTAARPDRQRLRLAVHRHREAVLGTIVHDGIELEDTGQLAPGSLEDGEGRAKKPSVRISTHPTARGCDSSHRAIEPVARVTPVTTIRNATVQTSRNATAVHVPDCPR